MGLGDLTAETEAVGRLDMEAAWFDRFGMADTIQQKYLDYF